MIKMARCNVLLVTFMMLFAHHARGDTRGIRKRQLYNLEEHLDNDLSNVLTTASRELGTEYEPSYPNPPEGGSSAKGSKSSKSGGKGGSSGKGSKSSKSGGKGGSSSKGGSSGKGSKSGGKGGGSSKGSKSSKASKSAKSHVPAEKSVKRYPMPDVIKSMEEASMEYFDGAFYSMSMSMSLSMSMSMDYRYLF